MCVVRTFIVGCKGQLGRDLISVFAAAGEVEGADLPELDITDADAVTKRMKGFKPHVVLNAAAYTDVEAAEANREAAFLANETGARNIAYAAREADAAVVYYSTDYVFGGTKDTPYVPDDPVNPIGVYAQSKLAGEVATAEETDRHFVIRTAWLYGPGGNNFVEKILRAAEARPELRVVEDEVGAPTYTWDLAEATQALVRTDKYGVYHAVNAGSCSRDTFARAIIEEVGGETLVSPCASSEFRTAAERPLYSVLSTETLEKVSGYHFRPWREALRAYMTARELSE